MRTIETRIYTFAELSDAAKQKATEWAEQTFEHFWGNEGKESIRTFCDKFDISLTDWQYSPYDYRFSHDAKNKNFRGLKLKDFDREEMPTGYYLDNVLHCTFYDTLKNTGSALRAFDAAINAAFRSMRDDWAGQFTGEYLSDHFDANNYEFTESGEPY